MHGDDRLVLAKNWLVARREIDDRQPPHPESDSVIHPDALRNRDPRCTIDSHIECSTPRLPSACSVDDRLIQPVMPHIILFPAQW